MHFAPAHLMEQQDFARSASSWINITVVDLHHGHERASWSWTTIIVVDKHHGGLWEPLGVSGRLLGQDQGQDEDQGQGWDQGQG